MKCSSCSKSRKQDHRCHVSDVNNIRHALKNGLKLGRSPCRFLFAHCQLSIHLLKAALPLLQLSSAQHNLGRHPLNITERKHIEQALVTQASELARSNEELTQFAYVVSHDLQEPLRLVMSHTQLLERRYQPQLGDEGQELVQHIVEGARRMHRLIQHLLAYAKAGSVEIAWEAADIRSALEVALSHSKKRLEKNHATVTHDELPTVWTDSVQLAQVFQNLIGNAVKYRKPDLAPHIHISVRREGGEWIFSFADNGQGFDPQHVEQVFGLFKQLHGREIPGTGIGLALCRRAIERLGGRIGATAEPGHGATFAFTLPDV